MADRLKFLAFVYFMPSVIALIYAFKDGWIVNGEALSVSYMMSLGFFLGVALEGVIMVIFVTIATLVGRLD